MVRQKLFEDRNVCVLPARHPYAKRLTLERFATLPHFQISPRGLNEDFVEAALKKHQLMRTVVARVPALHGCAAVGVGREGHRGGAGAHAWSALGLRVVEAPLPLPGFSMASSFPETSRHDPAHLWFRRLLTGCVRV